MDRNIYSANKSSYFEICLSGEATVIWYNLNWNIFWVGNENYTTEFWISQNLLNKKKLFLFYILKLSRYFFNERCCCQLKVLNFLLVLLEIYLFVFQGEGRECQISDPIWGRLQIALNIHSTDINFYNLGNYLHELKKSHISHPEPLHGRQERHPHEAH